MISSLNEENMRCRSAFLLKRRSHFLAHRPAGPLPAARNPRPGLGGAHNSVERRPAGGPKMYLNSFLRFGVCWACASEYSALLSHECRYHYCHSLFRNVQWWARVRLMSFWRASAWKKIGRAIASAKFCWGERARRKIRTSAPRRKRV